MSEEMKTTIKKAYESASLDLKADAESATKKIFGNIDSKKNEIYKEIEQN
ncbi:MAG: hypothetical protein LUP94_00305 [Candidatus Methanomethylicus sp.]|nr:hypothetical protein [Candidatus Methanomethylicus sp.]